MTFEEWREIHAARHSMGQDSDDEGLILADWKAEREERLRKEQELADLTAKTCAEIFEKSESRRAERDKLIGALENVLRNAECETSKHYAVENCAENGLKNPCEVCRARAVLAEVKGEKKLPGFKDIIGLFVDGAEKK